MNPSNTSPDDDLAPMPAKSALRRHLPDIAAYAFLIVMTIFSLGPVLWGLSTALKPPDQVIASPPVFLPATPTLENFKTVVFNTPFPRFFANSVLVAVGTILLALVVAVPMAYATVRFRFKWKNALMFVLLTTVMIPGISILVPLFVIAANIKLLDTYAGLILVYGAWQAPLLVLLLRGFLETIPPEIEEAAMIDGCSRVKALIRVVLPVCGPGIAAASILAFMFVWNDWLIATILTRSESMRLAQVGLVRYIDDPIGISWGHFMAYTMLVVLPVLMAFALFQRRFIAALSGGAVKG
jgi:ABC-type glycerol-3-phosphate transport system permease component